MIKVDRERVEVKGTNPTLCTDLCLAIKTVYKTLSEDIGEDAAKEFIDDVYKTAFLSEGELEEKATKLGLEILMEALKEALNVE